MPQPETFAQLLDSIYQIYTPQNYIVITPYSGDINHLTSVAVLHWNAWEAQATMAANGIDITSERPIHQPHSIPDSVAARRRERWNLLVRNMPYGGRR